MTFFAAILYREHDVLVRLFGTRAAAETWARDQMDCTWGVTRRALWMGRRGGLFQRERGRRIDLMAN